MTGVNIIYSQVTEEASLAWWDPDEAVISAVQIPSLRWGERNITHYKIRTESANTHTEIVPYII